MTLLPFATAAHRAGLSIVPVTTDGSKRPALPTWTPYKDQAATVDQLAEWFGPHQALGVVCGTISGHLEMFEFEGRAVDEGLPKALVTALTDHGYGPLWDRLKTGWVEQTPGGGVHYYYRVEGEALPNTKLARRPATAAELEQNPKDKVKVLIETRGEGGFVVLAPSTGHDTGRPWTLVVGGPDSIPVITADERDALYAIANTLDTMPVATPPQRTGAVSPVETGERPGDDYNARTDWSEILLPLGWTHVATFGKTRTWRRPGKKDGISATTGRNDGDNLYVFSTSTEFDAETAYSKFHAYTLLEHAGNFSAAAKELRSQGYGAALEPSRPVLPDLMPGVVGNLATVTELQPRPKLEAVTERTLDRSDDGNALLLIDRFGSQIRYCHDRGKWLAWDGQRWEWCERGGGRIREYAKRIARSLPEDDQAALLHKRRSLGAIGTTAMLTQAATDNRISVSLADLDAHPWELNTPEGIVDLRTGALSPADPAKLHTRMTSCAPDPGADPARWQTFLADTFGDDTPLIGFLQRMVGYSAVGTVGAHVLPFCQGSGGNGKGVFLEALAKVLGDYATSAPSGFLMAQAHAKHETEIARLAGARMVLCSEVNEDDHFDEAKVKQLTGGDTLTARFMQQDHFTFTPTHHLWLMGNHRPSVRSGGRSFWRRLRLVEFKREVPAEKVVDDLQGILAREHGPALLAWIVAGAAEYHRNGLREPASVLAATEDYAHDQDTVTRFLEERCLLGGGEHVQIKVTVVRDAYEQWCRDAGEVPVSAKAFSIAVGRHGVGGRRTTTARLYVGLSLIGDDEDQHEQAWR